MMMCIMFVNLTLLCNIIDNKLGNECAGIRPASGYNDKGGVFVKKQCVYKKKRFLFLAGVMAVMLAFCGCSLRNREYRLYEFRGIGDLTDESDVSSSVDLDAPERPDIGLPELPPEAGYRNADGSDLTIQTDCLLQITVKEDPTLDGSYPVNEIGAVQMGYIGPVFLFNKTEEEAAEKIEEVLKQRDFRTANVKVRILRASYDNVRVSGAVNRPGLIRVGAGDTISLNDALLRAGGLKASATKAKVKIVRGGLLSAVAPALEGEEYLLVKEDGSPSVPDVSLRNNDIAYVYSSAPGQGTIDERREVLVLGEVRKQGMYQFSAAEPFTMMHLIFKMGGLPQYANKKNVKILRRDREGNEQEFVIDVEGILNDGNPDDDFPLENGDRVVVPARRISLF